MIEHSDIDLLEAYARERSEEAFRQLVARHVDFVYSVAMRQLRNPHLSQEATQSAFIALAGKAGQLRRETVIAGWLHRAVVFAALKLQRSEARRKHWEREAVTMSIPDESEGAFEELPLPQVDGALAELSEIDRNAIILRFLQQKAVREVAQALGTSEEAAKKRVSRALEKLRELLVRRGVTIPVAALAAGLSQIPVTAAPIDLPATLAALAVKTQPGAGLTLLASIKAKSLAIAALILLGGLTVFWWPAPESNSTASSTNMLQASSVRIKLTSVMVNDQENALKFYTEVLGFVKKEDVPAGGGRWLTVVSPAEPDGTELLLEPIGFAAARTYQAALFRAGIPLASFLVDDVQKKYEQMSKLGVVFSMKPTKGGPTTVAMFADTCGNHIQLFQPPMATNSSALLAPKIKLTSVMVADQEKALAFYTETLGFVKRQDSLIGASRWLTVVSPHEPEGTELLLEPMGLKAASTFQRALFKAGIPLTSFAVQDIHQEYERMTKLGVKFTLPPTTSGPVTIAMLDDTCGNLIQIMQQ